jgi:hypothetical protein
MNAKSKKRNEPAAASLDQPHQGLRVVANLFHQLQNSGHEASVHVRLSPSSECIISRRNGPQVVTVRAG